MKLSIIVPAYNRHKLTTRHVEECLKGTVLPDEIIVVNDGGDPSLKDMLPKSTKDTKIIYAQIEEDILWNYNGAVNLACWLSTGDILAIEDTDHIPDRNTYEIGLKALEDNPEVDRIGFGRKIVQVDAMDKPMEEWECTGTMGCNQMVAFLRRDVYLKLLIYVSSFHGQYHKLYHQSYLFPALLGQVHQLYTYYRINLSEMGWQTSLICHTNQNLLI